MEQWIRKFLATRILEWIKQNPANSIDQLLGKFNWKLSRFLQGKIWSIQKVIYYDWLKLS